MCDTDILNRVCRISKLLDSTFILLIHNGDKVGDEMADELERLDLLKNDEYCRVFTEQKLVVAKIFSDSESASYFSDLYGPVIGSTTIFIKGASGELLHVWDGRGWKPTESSTVSRGKQNTLPSVVQPSTSGLHRRGKDEDAVLQLRAADGSSATVTYPRGTTLAVVRDAVVKLLRFAPGTFSIVNPYPRYEFGETDFRRTLQDLRLYPNAVLFISPNYEATSTKPWMLPVSAVLEVLVNMFTSFWAFLRTFFNLERNRTADESGVPPKRRRRQGPRILSRRNVHSLHDNDSSSDDNATYNGNSTQQQ